MARRLILAALLIGPATGTAGAQIAEDQFLLAGFRGSLLSFEEVAVLPVGALVLPDRVPEQTDTEALTGSLINFSNVVLPDKLTETGAVRSTIGTRQMGPMIGAADRVAIQDAYRVIDALVFPDSQGVLDPTAQLPFEQLRQLVGPRYFLAPRELRLVEEGLLQYRGYLLVYLVDSQAGRVIWREWVSMDNRLPAKAFRYDLFEAFLQNAIAATASAAGVRLRSLGTL